MNIVLEHLKTKFPGCTEGLSEESKHKTHLVIAKSSLVAITQDLLKDFGMRFLFLFAADERGERDCFVVRYVFLVPSKSQFLILEIELKPADPTFPSVSLVLPQTNWQEREVRDLFGLKPLNAADGRRLVLHEDWPEGLFPLRKDFDPAVGRIPRHKGEYVFEKVEGEGVFEIPVGPVHAGIIEPGHFRFSSVGERILKLEIRHFYTHKGTEKLGEGKAPLHLICLAERISGDHSLAHGVACAQALEQLAGIQIPRRAQFLRVIFLELERLYNHVGDISGIVMDVAFGFGAAQLMRLKERFMRLNERLAGTRLLRAVVMPGGVRKDLGGPEKRFLIEEIREIKKDFERTVQIFWEVSSLVDRIEETGIIKKEVAEVLGGTGPLARASGIDRDLRRDEPYEAYGEFLFRVPVLGDGDVESRMQIRIQEIYESFKIIHDAVCAIPDGPCHVETGPLLPCRSALGYVESPRGECFHWISTDRKGRVDRWKIQSPSFANWPLIEHAVLENIVPDFPLINKSMNLSYSGNDR